MENSDLNDGELVGGAAVVGHDGSLHYEYSTNSQAILGSSQFLQDNSGTVLTLPIPFLQLHDPGGNTSNIKIINSADGPRAYFLDTSELAIGGEESGDEQRMVVPQDGAEGITVAHSIDTLQDSMVSVGQVSGDLGTHTGVILASSGEGGAPTQFLTCTIVDGQMMLTPADGSIEEGSSVTLEAGTIVAAAPSLQPVEQETPHSLPIPIAMKQEPDIEPPIGKGPFRCDICHQTLEKWPQYKKHLRKHLEDKPYRCHHCPASFNVEKNLSLHVALHSSGMLVCPECGKKFRRMASFKAHLSHHQEDEQVTCDICQQEFVSISQLEPHYQRHRQGLESGEEQQRKPTLECRQCPASFTSQPLLNHHMQAHKKVKKLTATKPRRRLADRSKFDNKCNFCGKTFIKPSQLERHNRIHTGERPYKCAYPGCERAFNQKGTMLIHMDIHSGKKPHTCAYCKKEFVQKSNLRCHIKRVHPVSDGGQQQFQCEECSCVFKRAGSLNAHISRAHPNETVIGINNLDEDMQEMVMHFHALKNQHETNGSSDDPESLLPRKKIKIEAASDVSDSHENISVECHGDEDSIINVSSIIVGDGGALIGGGSTSTSSTGGTCLQVETHSVDSRESRVLNNSAAAVTVLGINSARGTSLLSTTSKSPADGDILQQALNNSGLVHTKTGISKDDVSIKLEEMAHRENWGGNSKDPTNKEQKKVRLMTLIDRNETGTKRHTVLVRVAGDVKWHVCMYRGCSKEFKKPSDLVRHMRIHTNDKPFKCTKCFRAFAVKSTLVAHMKTHSLVKDYSCDKCSKKFATATSLRVHTWLHTGNKPYQCNQCPKRFRTVSQRKTHYMSHKHSPHRQAMRCRTIPLPDIPLQEPILITNQGPVKQMSRHSAVYPSETGELAPDRPHHCHYCPAAFKKSSHLKQHERTHTGERPYKCDHCLKQFSSVSVLKSHYKTHQGQKHHKCNLCGGFFATSGSLKRHCTTHTSDRPYMCPYCQKTFKTNTNCKKHMKTHKQELALEAVRAAGQNLQGDNQQALLTASLYSQQATTPATTLGQTEVIVSDLAGMTSVFSESDFPLTGDTGPQQQQQQGHAQVRHEDLQRSQVLSSNLSGSIGAGAGSLTLASLQHSNIEGGSGNIGSSAGSLTLASLQHSNIEGCSEPTAVILTSPSGAITTHHINEYTQGRSHINASSILLPHSEHSESSPTSGLRVATSSQDDRPTTTIVTLPAPNDGSGVAGTNIVSLHQPSVIQGPEGSMGRNQNNGSSNSDQVSVGGSVVSQQNSGSRFSSSRLLEHRSDFGTSLTDAESGGGNMEMVSISSSMIGGNASAGQVTFIRSAQVIQPETLTSQLNAGNNANINSHINITEIGSEGLPGGSGITDGGAGLTGGGLVESDEECPSITHLNSGRETTSNITITDADRDNNAHQETTHILEANFNTHGFSEGFTLHVPAGMDLSSLSGANGEIGGNQLVQLLNSHGATITTADGTIIKTDAFENAAPSTQRSLSPPIVDESKMLDMDSNKSFECSDCHKTFRKLPHLRAHRRIHSNGRSSSLQCGKCSQTFSSASALKEHVKQQHHENAHHQCGNCSAGFTSQAQLQKHIQAQHMSCWRCPLCDETLDSIAALQKHSQSHKIDVITPPYSKKQVVENISVVGEDGSSSSGKLLSGEPGEGKLLTVEHVDALLEQSRREVLETRHQDVDSDEQQQTSPQQKQRLLHLQTDKIKTQTHDMNIKTEAEEIDYKHPNHCPSCSKSFKKPSDLKRHIRTHTGEKPFPCVLCGKSFAVKSTLDVHLKTHSGKKEFECTVCNTMFATKGSLNIHMRLHTGDKPFRCATCGMKFRTSGHRKAHTIKHFKSAANGTTTASVNKNRQSSSEEGMEIVSGNGDAVVDVVNQVMLNPDGTMSVQIQGIGGISLGTYDASALLQNLGGTVTLDEQVLSQLQASGVTMMEDAAGTGHQITMMDDTTGASGHQVAMMEAGGHSGHQAVTDEDVEDSISVNPNVVMTQPGSVRTPNNQGQIDDAGGDFQIHMIDNGQVFTTGTLNMLGDDHMDRDATTSQESSTFLPQAHLNLSDLAISGPNNTIQCTLCSKTFVKLTDWQDHMISHNLVIRCDVDGTGSEGDLQDTNIYVTSTLDEPSLISDKPGNIISIGDLTVSKMDNLPTTSNRNHLKCTMPACGRTYKSQSSLDQHTLTCHMTKSLHECNICKQNFPQAVALQRHIKLHHNEKTGFGCIFCEEEFKGTSPLHQHIINVHLQQALENPLEIEKIGLKFSIGGGGPPGGLMEEELDPMMRELFPS